MIISRQYTEREAAISYLEGMIEKLRATRELRIEEPILYVKMQIAAFNLEKGNQKECKKYLEDGKTTLDNMTDIDPSVHATFYWVSSQYHKSRQEFAEFYKNALLYLAYTSVESLSESFKLVCLKSLEAFMSLQTDISCCKQFCGFMLTYAYMVLQFIHLFLTY